MEGQLSFMTRQELIRAVGKHYHTAAREKTEIPNESVEVTHYHWKYALQLLVLQLHLSRSTLKA